MDWHFFLSLDAHIDGFLDVETVPFSWKKHLYGQIGPIPILYAPYFQMKFAAATQPIGIHATAKYHYGMSYEYSYEYDNTRKERVQYKMNKEEHPGNGLKHSFSVKRDENGTPQNCPLELGVMLSATPTVGVFLYEFVKLALQPTLAIPITFKLPETKPDVLGIANGGQGQNPQGWWVCDQTTGDGWYASMWWQVKFGLALECGIDFSQMLQWDNIMKLWNGEKLGKMSGKSSPSALVYKKKRSVISKSVLLLFMFHDSASQSLVNLLFPSHFRVKCL